MSDVRITAMTPHTLPVVFGDIAVREPGYSLVSARPTEYNIQGSNLLGIHGAAKASVRSTARLVCLSGGQNDGVSDIRITAMAAHAFSVVLGDIAVREP
jgi:hypothetical protein